MKKKWTNQAILEDAKKYKTKTSWRKNSGGYSAAFKKGLLDKACSHMKSTNRICLKWTKEAILEDAKKYQSKIEWKKNSSGYYSAIKKGFLKEASAHMSSYIKPTVKWTKEAILEDAKKYRSKIEWKKNSNGYNAALKRGIIKEACSHMEVLWEKKWTKEAILEDAKKYNSRMEWHKNSTGYYVAVLNGWLDEACRHMKRVGGISKPELDLLKIIKQNYPKAQTLKDRKASFPDKPHIKGFDIDIYIPELRKGVEFNGKYWHSIDGLARSRKHWSQEDLENYHLLKTEYFKKKGIEILYIDEKEWLENPNTCLEKIKAFLS